MHMKPIQSSFWEAEAHQGGSMQANTGPLIRSTINSPPADGHACTRHLAWRAASDEGGSGW